MFDTTSTTQVIFEQVLHIGFVYKQIRDERECLFPSHSLPFQMVHSHSQSQV